MLSSSQHHHLLRPGHHQYRRHSGYMLPVLQPSSFYKDSSKEKIKLRQTTLEYVDVTWGCLHLHRAALWRAPGVFHTIKYLPDFSASSRDQVNTCLKIHSRLENKNSQNILEASEIKTCDPNDSKEQMLFTHIYIFAMIDSLARYFISRFCFYKLHLSLSYMLSQQSIKHSHLT